MLNSCCALPALGRHNDSWRWLPSDTPWLTRTTSPRSRVPSPRFRASAASRGGARRDGGSPRQDGQAGSDKPVITTMAPWAMRPGGTGAKASSRQRRAPSTWSPPEPGKAGTSPRSAPRSPPRALLRPRRRSWTRVPAFPVRLQRSILGTPDDAPLPYASPTRPPADPPARAHPLPQTATANSGSSS